MSRRNAKPTAELLPFKGQHGGRREGAGWWRRGKVFADRYHDRILETPREVRNAIRYVLANGKKHATEGRQLAVP